jgi:hypothetical protein
MTPVDALKAANLAVSFLVELAALAAFALWGLHIGSSRPAQIALGIGLPLAGALVWGLFAAPRAAISIPGPAIVAVQALVLGLGVVALFASGHPRWAAVLAVVLIVNTALAWAWHQ